MKIVQGVTYRNIAGYLKVVGRTKPSAKRHAKTIGTLLLQRLPAGTTLTPGRYKGIQSGFHVYEVPVILSHPNVRKVLAEIALRGGG